MGEPFVYSGPSRLVDGFRVRAQSLEGSLRAYVAEGLGTFLLTFACGASLCLEALHGQLGPTGIALAQGACLAALTLILAHVSGAHFNPAVTLAMVAVKRQGLRHGGFYILAQLLGAGWAGAALRSLFERHGLAAAAPWLGTPTAAPELASLELLGLEAALAFAWTAAVFATQIDPRGSKRAAAAAVGLVLGAAFLLAGPLTGASLNPARALGPALGAWHWTDLHLYVTGPVLGSLAAAGLYEYGLLRPTGT